MLLFTNHNILHSLKKQTLFVCFFISLAPLLSQNNLVINGGFDIYKTPCPLSINDLPDWYVTTFSSPDIYHYCNSPSQNGIPKNFFGNQEPLSDSGYAGLIVYSSYTPNSNIREYMTGKLNTFLKKGYTYCIEFNISLADTCNYAISSFGIYFSSDSIKSSCLNCVLNYIPQVQNDSLNIVVDKQNWTKISESFIANGGERYMTFGNFFNDNMTTKNLLKVSNYNSVGYSGLSYYYIDNVSVYACDSPLVEEPQDTTFVFIPNVFSPNQDGENDLWEITASKVSSLNIQVFNRWGEQVYSFNSAQLSTLDIQPSIPINRDKLYNPAWDGYTPTGKPVPQGTYFYVIQYTLPSGETKVEKGYVTLLR